jgi:hypothetical protein
MKTEPEHDKKARRENRAAAAGGEQPPHFGLLTRNGELFTRRGELMQLSPA